MSKRETARPLATDLVEDAEGGGHESVGVDVERAWVGAGRVCVVGGRGGGGGGHCWESCGGNGMQRDDSHPDGF